MRRADRERDRKVSAGPYADCRCVGSLTRASPLGRVDIHPNYRDNSAQYDYYFVANERASRCSVQMAIDIDPPFDTGDNFSFARQITGSNTSLTKE